jgi:hypothetical protein
VAHQGSRRTTGILRGVAVLVLAVDGADDWAVRTAHGVWRSIGRLGGRHGLRQGEPVCLARGRHVDRLRCSGVLSLDPAQASGVPDRRRLSHRGCQHELRTTPSRRSSQKAPFRNCPNRGMSTAAVIILADTRRVKWIQKFLSGVSQAYVAGVSEPFRKVSHALR